MARKLPKGWNAYEFDDVATIASGQVDPKKTEFSGLPLVGSENLPSGGGDLIGEILSAKKIGAISGKYLFKPRQVIYSKIRPNLNKLWLSSFDGLCSADIYPITFDEERVLPEYAYYFMLGDQFRKVAVSASMRSGIPKVNRDDLSSAIIAAPSTVEQRRIVRVLDAADRQITLSERIATEATQQANAIVRELITGITADDVEFSRVVSRVKRSPINGNEVPLTISAEIGLVPQTRFFDKRVASDVVDTYTLIRRGEFAYNKSYSNGYPYGVIKRLEEVEEGVLSSLYLCFQIDDEKALNGDYLAAICESGFFNRQIHMIAHEGARNHGLLNVSAEDFFAMTLPLPSMKEQKRIAEAVRLARMRSQRSRARLEALQQQKRGLMQQLLTGRQRLTRDLPGMESGHV